VEDRVPVNESMSETVATTEGKVALYKRLDRAMKARAVRE